MAAVETQITQITERLGWMLDYASRAVELAGQCGTMPLEREHAFWALAKYSENVQEAATSIDNINNTVFSALGAIPQSDWENLKSMRIWLAHKFWAIDPNVLWWTATKEFPDLIALLTNLAICESPCDFPNLPPRPFTGKQYRELQPIDPDGKLTPKSSLTSLAVDNEGKAWAFSLGRNASGRIFVASSRPGKISLRLWKMGRASDG